MKVFGFYDITKICKCRVGQNWVADEFKKQNAINGNWIYYQGIWNIKKNLKAFQNFVAIFKINSIDFIFFLFLYVELVGFVVVAYQFRVRFFLDKVFNNYYKIGFYK